MGKSLRGKECGKGICQRKDGLYSARFVSSEGKRQVECFSSLPEARNWLDVPSMQISTKIYLFRQI